MICQRWLKQSSERILKTISARALELLAFHHIYDFKTVSQLHRIHDSGLTWPAATHSVMMINELMMMMTTTMMMNTMMMNDIDNDDDNDDDDDDYDDDKWVNGDEDDVDE